MLLCCCPSCPGHLLLTQSLLYWFHRPFAPGARGLIEVVRREWRHKSHLSPPEWLLSEQSARVMRVGGKKWRFLFVSSLMDPCFLHDSRYAPRCPLSLWLRFSAEFRAGARVHHLQGQRRSVNVRNFPLQRDSDWPFFILSVPFYETSSLFSILGIEDTLISLSCFFWKLKRDRCVPLLCLWR